MKTISITLKIGLSLPSPQGEGKGDVLAKFNGRSNKQSAENFGIVCYNYHGILCEIWRKGG